MFSIHVCIEIVLFYRHFLAVIFIAVIFFYRRKNVNIDVLAFNRQLLCGGICTFVAVFLYYLWYYLINNLYFLLLIIALLIYISH
jgi:hypothetical protein